jgi:hypothetical protein
LQQNLPEADNATGFRQVAIEYVWYRTAPGRHNRPGLGGQGHEILIKRFRTFSYYYLVNLVAVQLERYRSVANRNRLRRSASQRHGRRAEAGGKAESSGGNAADVEPGGTHGCTSPDISTRSNAIACARFDNGEACRA